MCSTIWSEAISKFPFLGLETWRSTHLGIDLGYFLSVTLAHIMTVDDTILHRKVILDILLGQDAIRSTVNNFS
jgi:hypothetical protein